MTDSLSPEIKLPNRDDDEKIDTLFRDFYPRLTTYACLFVEPAEAEDIVQDIFIYIWEHDELIIHTSLKSYLFKSVYLRCLNQIKQKKNRRHQHKLIEEYLFEAETRFFDPEKNGVIRDLLMNELGEKINEAIDSLPEKCRETFMLSYIYDLKNKEISEMLGVSLSTVENHIYNALKVLRQKLGKYSYLINLFFPF